jgi:chemotaxis protein MotB
VRQAPRRNVDPNRDRWMVSYMDVLTILLIFFVAATAQAVLPKATSAAAPAPPPRAAVAPHQQKLASMGLDLTRDPRGLVITLPQTVLFESGNDAINANALPMVERIAAVLREIPNRVTLIGHADAVPIHNRRFKNNWELAAARGLRLLELLGRDGIDESRLSVTSYSSFNPKDSNETADGRASNRRVEIVILDE